MQKAIAVSTIVLLLGSLTVAGILYSKVKKQEKTISYLKSENSDLEDDLDEIKAKLDDLEENNEELLSQLQDQLDERASLRISNYSSLPGYSGSTTSYGPVAGAYETHISGSFEGWDGDTIFKMMDGSIWQQEEYSYTYHYAYNPEVLLYNKNGSTYMKVEDVDEEIRVKRIK